ncbi:MAG: phage integrase N-terminal SAM-like domain-containing protein [Candidatus Marinimicrobia bacterium]|nr:phage integrase N-terminal SAM-like domain-containing protein [Candidatus Neomarinimicrobiota bacterium]
MCFNRNDIRKTELLKTVKQKLAIRNYSKRTIDSYLSAVNHFANWLIQEKVTTVIERVVEKYLFELKENKKRSIFPLLPIRSTSLHYRDLRFAPTSTINHLPIPHTIYLLHSSPDTFHFAALSGSPLRSDINHQPSSISPYNVVRLKTTIKS